MHNQTLRIAVAIGINGRIGTRRIHKRIVFGDRSINIDPVNFSVGFIEPLSIILFAPITDREIDMPGIIESDPAAIMKPGIDIVLFFGFKQHLLACPLIINDFAAYEARHRRSFGAFKRVGIGQIDPGLTGIMGIDCNIQ